MTYFKIAPALFGDVPYSLQNQLFATEELAECALDAYVDGKETENYLARFASDPSERLDMLMNIDYIDWYDEYRVEEVELEDTTGYEVIEDDEDTTEYVVIEDDEDDEDEDFDDE